MVAAEVTAPPHAPHKIQGSNPTLQANALLSEPRSHPYLIQPFVKTPGHHGLQTSLNFPKVQC